MALIAIYAVIHIPADVRVAEIVRVPAPMATRTLENCVVVRIRVTDRANSVSSIPSMGHREPRMVKSCSSPCSCVVARSASCGEDRRRSLMNRIDRAIVSGFVAAVAVCRECRVVVIYVTTGAGHLNVEASQREGRGVVIKLPIGPECGVMAELASRGEADLDVVNRSGCRVVSVQVTGNACRVRARQTVVVVDVAIGAGPRRNGVRVG